MKLRLSSSRATVMAGLALIVGMPVTLPAVEIHIQSDTRIYGMERDIGGVEGQMVAPGYEYLRIDAGQLQEKGFSFHSYGWGRLDFADNEFFEHREDGELLYGYLQYADPESGLDLRVGRQTVAGGVGNDAIDGLQLSGDLGPWLVALVYGGQPVGFSSDNGRTDDLIYGGRLGIHQGRFGELGVSYKNLENNNVIAEEALGLDLSLFLPANISLSGFSNRNLDSKGWAEHSYELQIPLNPVLIRPYFGEYDYEHYFGTGVNTVNPFRVLAINGEKLRVIGLDTTWKYSDAIDLALKIKGNDYDRMNGSEYASGLVTWHGAELTQVGVEVGYMKGDLDKQKYLLTRLFGYLDGLEEYGIGFMSGDVVWARYDQPIYGKDDSLFVSLGVGRDFLDEAVEVELSADYSRDPYFDADLRGLFSVTYRYDHE
ncbi:MAG: hypothetical protein KJ950_13115 [Proteobacteria bacterium]|nr:hypothetical protein [Pseudomonadota bacterium]MBU1688418.1 hypothetical protein [Pseudomonadota bacterium]